MGSQRVCDTPSSCPTLCSCLHHFHLYSESLSSTPIIALEIFIDVILFFPGGMLVIFNPCLSDLPFYPIPFGGCKSTIVLFLSQINLNLPPSISPTIHGVPPGRESVTHSLLYICNISFPVSFLQEVCMLFFNSFHIPNGIVIVPWDCSACE